MLHVQQRLHDTNNKHHKGAQKQCNMGHCIAVFAMQIRNFPSEIANLCVKWIHSVCPANLVNDNDDRTGVQHAVWILSVTIPAVFLLCTRLQMTFQTILHWKHLNPPSPCTIEVLHWLIMTNAMDAHVPQLMKRVRIWHQKCMVITNFVDLMMGGRFWLKLLIAIASTLQHAKQL